MIIEREERISLRAFHIWQSAGCPDGHGVDHWAQAERELQTEDSELPTAAEKASDDNAQKPRESRRGMT